MVQVCTVYVTKTVSVFHASMASLGDDCGAIVSCVGPEGISLTVFIFLRPLLTQHFLI